MLFLKFKNKVLLFFLILMVLYIIARQFYAFWSFYHGKPVVSIDDLNGIWKIDANSLKILSSELKYKTYTNNNEHLLMLNVGGNCHYNGEDVFSKCGLYSEHEEADVYYRQRRHDLTCTWELCEMPAFCSDYFGADGDECYGIRCHYHVILKYRGKNAPHICYKDYFHVGHDINGIYLWKNTAINYDCYGPHKIIFRK